MRTPTQYVAAAVANLRTRLMRDCAEMLCHGDRAAVVTRIGARRRGEDALTASDLTEAVRVLASAADFPCIAQGSLVALDGSRRIVTSANEDISRTVLTIGMSAAMDAVRVAYSRPGTRIRFSADALAVEGGETTEVLSDAPAIAASRTWYVAISAAQWFETTEPHVGDALTLCAATAKMRFNDVKLRVAAAEKRDGYWILTARTRGAQW